MSLIKNLNTVIKLYNGWEPIRSTLTGTCYSSKQNGEKIFFCSVLKLVSLKMKFNQKENSFLIPRESHLKISPGGSHRHPFA